MRREKQRDEEYEETNDLQKRMEEKYWERKIFFLFQLFCFVQYFIFDLNLKYNNNNIFPLLINTKNVSTRIFINIK